MKRAKGLFKIFRSIHFKIPILFIFLLIATLQFIGVSFLQRLEVNMTEDYTNQVSLQTGFLVRGLTPILTKADSDTLQSDVAELLLTFSGEETKTISTQVIDSTGYIVGTSNRVDQSAVGTRSTDVTVQQVLLSGTKATYRYLDPTTRVRVLKTVIPIVAENNNKVLGVLEHDAEIETIYVTLNSISRLFLQVSGLAIIVTSILAFLVSRGLTVPIAEMQERTEKIAEGDYEGRTTVYGGDELGVLAESINDLSVKIKDATESTESERQRLDSVLKHMSDGVIATDRRGRVTMINDAALDLLAVSDKVQVIGRSIMSVLRLNQFYTFRQLLETQDELILRMPGAGQETMIIRGEFSVIQRESGFISGLVCVLSDITEQEKIEKERREFVSNVSHELRTPLTSVKSYTDALSEGAWKSPTIAPKFLKVIQHETERMIRMISDLLDLSRMDAGRQELNKEIVNMRDLFRSILERYDMLLRSDAYIRKDYRVRREFSDSPVWAEIDQDRMTQVIDNIMNNAIKYSPDGGSITCRLIETDGRIIISVTDEGLGIPRKSLNHIFERFYRVDKARSREQGGSGLGLAISKEVVEHHGGKIWATSEEHKGSTFYISLPAVAFDEFEEDWE